MWQTHQTSNETRLGGWASGPLGEGLEDFWQRVKVWWMPNLASALWGLWRKASWSVAGVKGLEEMEQGRDEHRGGWAGEPGKDSREAEPRRGQWDGMDTEERFRNRGVGKAWQRVEMRPFSVSLWKHRWVDRVLALEVQQIQSCTPDQWCLGYQKWWGMGREVQLGRGWAAHLIFFFSSFDFELCSLLAWPLYSWTLPTPSLTTQSELDTMGTPISALRNCFLGWNVIVLGFIAYSFVPTTPFQRPK